MLVELSKKQIAMLYDGLMQDSDRGICGTIELCPDPKPFCRHCKDRATEDEVEELLDKLMCAWKNYE